MTDERAHAECVIAGLSFVIVQTEPGGIVIDVFDGTICVGTYSDDFGLIVDSKHGELLERAIHYVYQSVTGKHEMTIHRSKFWRGQS